MSDREGGPSRPELIETCSLGGHARGGAAAQAQIRTPTQILGRFYPVIEPVDQEADRTMSAGRTGRAAGSRAS